MTIVIKDGTGNGYIAAVDASNRLTVHSNSQDIAITATRNGGAFGVLSTVITLTSANESAILYFTTNETSNLVISNILFDLGASANGTTTDVVIKNYVGVTGGTIISNASAALVANLNATSSNTLDATTYKGAEADTLVGPAFEGLLQSASNIQDVGGGIIPKGTSFGYSITPPPGNTSMKVSIRLFMYLEDSI